jgi:glucose-6-phosphate isomerase
LRSRPIARVGHAKVLTTKILGELESPTEPPMAHDTSTTSLIRRYRKSK